MKKIIRINLHQLKNETHVQFNEGVNSQFAAYRPVAGLFRSLYILYKSAFDRELESLDLIPKSDFTPLIINQDRVRDGIFRGLVDTLKGATHHFDPAVSEAAHLLLDTVNHYGNIAAKTFDDETAAINDLARELQTPAQSQRLGATGLTPWLDKLLDENAKFTALMTSRYNSEAAKTSYRMRTTRLETDKYYHALVNQVENLTLTGDTTVDPLISELNAIIKRFKHILAQEIAARKKPDAAE